MYVNIKGGGMILTMKRKLTGDIYLVVKASELGEGDNYGCSMVFKALRSRQLSERESSVLIKLVENFELSKFFGRDWRN